MATRKMHADEIPTDAQLVRRLLAAQFPEWSDLPITPVPSSGTDNALYRLGDEMVVRLPRIHWALNDIAKDFRWLPVLAPRLPVAIPTPLARGAPGEGYPAEWGVYRWLDGENPVAGRLEDAAGLATDAAGFIAALRRIERADAPAASRGRPLAVRDADTRAAIAQLGASVDANAVSVAWEAARAAPAWSGPPVWVHGDLLAGNLLVRQGRLTGVIDFSGTGVGDPACDLMVAWNLLPPEARSILRDELGVDDATWARARGLALSWALIALPYYEDTNPPFAASARHTLGEVLADRRPPP